MGVLVGIDEAGYGPILGPLVVSMAAFRLGDTDVLTDPPACLWRRLGRRVVLPDRPKGRAARSDRRLVVCDSKVLYQGGRGLDRMEEAVLAFFALAAGAGAGAGAGPGAEEGRTAATLAGLCLADLSLAGLALEGAAERRGASGSPPGATRSATSTLERYPWYEGLSVVLPRHTFRSVLARRVASLGAALARAKVDVLGLVPEVRHPREFNGGVRESGNKHLFEWKIIGRLLRATFERWGAEGALVSVDQLSGRRSYGPGLGRLFPGARVTAVHLRHRPADAGWAVVAGSPAGGDADGARGTGRENGSGSGAGARAAGPSDGDDPTYEVRQGERVMRVRFLKGGDGRRFEIALASMLSKYVRELYMEPLNTFFGQHVPGLRPTAGYAQDGRRFVADVEPAIAALGLDRGLLVRVV